MLAQRVELVLEEAGGRPDRVGEIDHDHVELAVQLRDRLERVARPDLYARVGQRLTRHLVVLARDLHDLLVELEEIDALDPRMLQDLGDEMHVAPAHHGDIARVRVREQRGVRQHLVVHVGVEIGHLDDAVQREHPTEPRRLEEHDFLELRAPLLEHHSHVVRGVRRAARFELLEPPRGELGRDAPLEEADVDLVGLEGVAQHADDGFHVDVLAAGEQVGGDIAVLRPGVDREVALRDHRDARDTVRREPVHEDVDERDLARHRRGAQRVLGALDGVEVRRAPELTNGVPTNSACVQKSPPPEIRGRHATSQQLAGSDRCANF